MPIHNFPHNVVYWSQVEDHDDIKAELLPKIQEADKNCIDSGNPYPLCKFRTNITDPKLFIIDDALLHKIVWKHVHDFMSNLNFKIDEPSSLQLEYWYNIYHDSDFQEMHNHVNIVAKIDDYIEYNLISGIYILDDKNDHQNITFGSCAGTSSYPFLYPDKTHQFYTRSIDDIKEGTVLLFPSTLEHGVYHVNSKFPRTSIAFNVAAKYNHIQ